MLNALLKENGTIQRGGLVGGRRYNPTATNPRGATAAKANAGGGGADYQNTQTLPVGGKEGTPKAMAQKKCGSLRV